MTKIRRFPVGCLNATDAQIGGGQAGRNTPLFIDFLRNRMKINGRINSTSLVIARQYIIGGNGHARGVTAPPPDHCRMRTIRPTGIGVTVGVQHKSTKICGLNQQQQDRPIV